MKNLWTWIDNKAWKATTKFKAALLILGILYALAGFSVWLVISIWMLSTPDWMLCFIGYPVVVSWFTVYFYFLRHGFHNGAPSE